MIPHGSRSGISIRQLLIIQFSENHPHRPALRSFSVCFLRSQSWIVRGYEPCWCVFIEIAGGLSRTGRSVEPAISIFSKFFRSFFDSTTSHLPSNIGLSFHLARVPGISIGSSPEPEPSALPGPEPQTKLLSIDVRSTRQGCGFTRAFLCGGKAAARRGLTWAQDLFP